MKINPRPTTEAAMPMPDFAPALRELEEGAGVREEGGGARDAKEERLLIGDVGDAEDVEGPEDVEDMEDEVMLVLEEVEETDVVGLDALCIVRDSGDGA